MGAADSIRRNGVVVSETAPVKRGDTFAIGDCELRVIRSSQDNDLSPSTSDADSTVTMPRFITNTELNVRSSEPSSAVEFEDAGAGSELRALQIKLQELVLRELDLFRRPPLNNLGTADLRAEAKQAIEGLIASSAVQLPAGLNQAKFIGEMTAEIM